MNEHKMMEEVEFWKAAAGKMKRQIGMALEVIRAIKDNTGDQSFDGLEDILRGTHE